MQKKILKDDEYKSQISNKMTVDARKFKELLSRGINYKPKLAQILRFNLWKISAELKKDNYPGDYDYWQDKGWLDKDYYYPIKINLFQKIILKIMIRKIRNKIKKAV
jgi:hypothetical protein